MFKSKICLCLTGSTLSENLNILNKYRNWIDIAELRVDYLTEDERLYIRRFPEMAKVPCILTIRRKIDGGAYVDGEATRTLLFARGLAFADQDVRKNFAYVDFEEDFHVPSLQDAALAFETGIIRSVHSMDGPIKNIPQKIESLRTTGYEIPKVAFMPRTLSDVTNLFRQSKDLRDKDSILVAMGGLGLPSRILASRLHSFLTYTSPVELSDNLSHLGQIDPITLSEIYNFRSITQETSIFGITGYPLHHTQSPAIHNEGYKNYGLDSVYIPVRAENVDEAIEFADQVGIKGMSVTIPHKQSVLSYMKEISSETGDIGACNTIVKNGSDWYGYNTDAFGLMEALKKFLGIKNLKHMKVSIIGAGGASCAAAYVVKELGGKACIFNRTISKAKDLAEKYNFKYAVLSAESKSLLDEYSDLFIQTTSIGMGSTIEEISKDPIDFYDFKGSEAVYDVIYTPAKTALLKRAEEAGCKISNGLTMLQYQAEQQFYLFTGVKYE